MKTSKRLCGLVTGRFLLAAGLGSGALALGLAALALTPNSSAQTQGAASPKPAPASAVRSYKHDVSPPLRDGAKWPGPDSKEEHEGPLNPRLPNHHIDQKDPVVQNGFWLKTLAPAISGTILNFEGIGFPGVGCNCLPPDTNGVVGATQYVQIVNKGYQVFDKTTGASQLGPNTIASVWAGFGGACENGGAGDPVVLYDHLANRWVITEFATPNGFVPITDECIAVSTTSDAAGTYSRYGFHLGENFYDYPHLAVWPDAYYMSMNVFNSSGTAFLGPQPFAFDRAAMVAGNAVVTMVTTGITGGSSEDAYLPADLDGSILPPSGSPESFVEFPGTGAYRIFHFHADFVTPANTTFTLFASPAAAGFTILCPGFYCIPQPGTSTLLEGLGDRLMFRLAYRKFADGHESVVGNFSVDAGNGVAGVRWFELRDLTAGPAVVYQESTYAPDDTSRWMGSVAMDADGDIAVGFSASSSTVFPSIRYAGRLTTDPLNTLPQGEETLIEGGGSQTNSSGRWGDYSDMTVDPVDDHTFWYTTEYLTETSDANWKTRIGNFLVEPKAPIVITSGGASIVKAGSNGAPDPGETVTVALGLNNFGSGGCTVNLKGTLQATGGVTNPTPATRKYRPLCVGDPEETQKFTFTVDPTLACGSVITASLVVTDGATSYGTVTYAIQTGVPGIRLAEAFDSVTAPALPTGWVATNAAGPAPLWVTSAASPDTAPNDVFVDDPATVSDKRLTSPRATILTSIATVSFRNNYNLEGGFDGGVLEISSPNINGGAFTDVTDPAVGGSFVSGGYTGTISSSFGSHIAGRKAWTGNAGRYLDTVVNLGPKVAGQSILLRFRMASDTSVSAGGWSVDGITLMDGFDCHLR